MKYAKRILCLLLILAFCFALAAAASASDDPDEMLPPAVDGELESETVPPDGTEAAEPEDAEPEDEAPALEDKTPAPENALPDDEDAGIISCETIYITGGEALDNDALFAAYAESLFYGEPLTLAAPSTDGKAVGDRLTGITAAVYQALRAMVAEVASGSRTSTVFSIELSAKGYSLSNFGDIDFDSLYDALLFDCPFDLYWHDKTSGFGVSGYSNSTGVYVEFSFAIADGYGSGTTTNGRGASVTKAASTAQSIVNKYASKSDYEKLVGYRQEICTLVSYNYSALSNPTADGNPWQLIYVFDGNSSTNVVCEGYSKAFQYLCDLTTFRSPQVSCYTVSGKMAGGTGAGDHMWNIVTMDDGKNYLVDVTNCDEDTVGSPDYLFLRGYKSGSVSAGYTFGQDGRTEWHGSSYTTYPAWSIKFVYDSETTSLYSTAELTLSKTDYEPTSDVIPMTLPGAAQYLRIGNPATAYQIVRQVVGLK